MFLEEKQKGGKGLFVLNTTDRLKVRRTGYDGSLKFMLIFNVNTAEVLGVYSATLLAPTYLFL